MKLSWDEIVRIHILQIFSITLIFATMWPDFSICSIPILSYIRESLQYLWRQPYCKGEREYTVCRTGRAGLQGIKLDSNRSMVCNRFIRYHPHPTPHPHHPPTPHPHPPIIYPPPLVKPSPSTVLFFTENTIIRELAVVVCIYTAGLSPSPHTMATVSSGAASSWDENVYFRIFMKIYFR